MVVLSLQYLRAIAALLVVYHHAVVTPRYAQGAEDAGSAFGAVGVDIFS